jgi:hypothetical protein
VLKGARAISDLIQIIHSSQPFGYAAHSLGGILLDARRCTTRDDITGALVCRHDIYLQLLEGPADKVQAAFERILRDDRHIDMTKLMSEPVTERLFADWAMLHDPAKSVAWSEADISEAVLDRATPAEVKSVFEKLAVKVRDAALSA